LARDPAAARRRWLLGAAAVAAIALGLVAYQRAIEPAGAGRPLCRGAERKLDPSFAPMPDMA